MSDERVLSVDPFVDALDARLRFLQSAVDHHQKLVTTKTRDQAVPRLRKALIGLAQGSPQPRGDLT